MTPLHMPLGQAGFPSGYEHLNASRLLEGYTDHGEYAEWTAGLETSPTDAQQYRLIRLKNGMECMLVHNPTAETCAASMAVRVGHLQDPDELPGLAHFLEHLLFMGSAKYPGENEYAHYLSKFGGWSNAYTSTNQTVYYFETTYPGFEGALDRFAQFFVSPLFNENCVEKEIRAVDSEHRKNLQDDSRRLFYLRKALSKPDHPFHKFGTGNLETLWNRPRALGLDVRAELIKFYEKHYSANLMKLCIASRDPLDTALSKVLRYFNEVPNCNIPPTIFPPEPYPDVLHMTRIAMKQIKDQSCILIQMPFYDSSKTLGSNPASMISYLLSNEGRHSLFGFLKNKDLVTDVEAYPYDVAPGIHFYVIKCGLTHEGVKHHQLVASTVYEYIKLLKNQPFPAWVFEELRQMLQIRFRFLETRGPVSNAAIAISVALQSRAPRAHIFAAPYTLTDQDPKSLKHALSYLVKDKAQIIVASPVEVEGLTYNERDRWYGTEYAIDPLKSEWFKASLIADEKFSLPEENRFIPKNLQIIGNRDTSKPFPRPLLIKQTEGQRIWFKQDDRWKVPKGSFFIKLSNPFMKASYKNGVICGSYLYLVNDALRKYAREAAVGGLHYRVSHHESNIEIAVSGFTDKFADLLKLIVHELKHLRFDQKAFDLMKEEKLKSLENETHDRPVEQVRDELSWILNSSGTTFDQRKEIMNAMKPEDIESFSSELLSKFYVEALCHGNFAKTTVYELVSMTEEVLDYGRLPRSAILPPRSRIIPEKSNFVVRMVASSKEEVNNAIHYYTSVGHPNDPDLFARLLLLRALIAEPCFNTLRTKEQLGYIVRATTMAGTSHCGLVVMIQSARSPVHLELRINAFLSDFARTLEAMELEKFESAQNGLISNLLEDYKNQISESSAYWSHIADGSYDFFQSDRLTALLKPLSLRDIHAFYMEHVHPASETRAKVSVHLYSHRVHLTDIDKLVEVLDEHKVDCELVKAAVKEQPLPKALREVVEKHIKATVPDLHTCCKEEVLREVDALEEFASLEKDLSDVQVLTSAELKESLVIGEPRKPIGDFCDGIANL